MKKEDLQEYVNYIFKQNENIPKKERYVRVHMYCKTYGLNNITNFNHCRNEECPSCNLVTKAMEDVLTQMTFKPYEK